MNGNGNVEYIGLPICSQGPLWRVLDKARGEGWKMGDLSILQNDPYRLDTPANHCIGQWFAEQVNRFVSADSTVHLRGLHYLIASAGDVFKPDHECYVNSDEDWHWMQEKASKAARWLGYVPFNKISDARNEEARIYIPEHYSSSPGLMHGDTIDMWEIADLMPRFSASFFARQKYRIILITEKSSLSPILKPFAEHVGGELIPMTGETSDTRIAELATRAAKDGRPAVVLYFSDHDPSGWQMPISVSRKLQALRDLLYPDLDIQVRRAALTAEQAKGLDLPSTPLKDTERRAANWLKKTGREQTELDALIALHPEALREIALEAIKPFFDDTLGRRVSNASEEWHEEADGRLAYHPDYDAFAERIELARLAAEQAAESYNALVMEAHEALSDIEPPPVHVPQAEPPDDAIDDPLFTTRDDFISATVHLKDQRELNDFKKRDLSAWNKEAVE